MDKRELQKLLNEPYDQENWKDIVRFVFPHVSILSTPKEFPIPDERIKRFSQIGTVRLTDGKNLALFELLLADNVNIHRNRVALNKVVSKYIDQEQIHGVLSVYEQGSEDYRFTFSARSNEFDEEEGDFVQKATDTRRYTYVLGKNESCKTPAERFYNLSQHKDDADINAVQSAFSVEQLSKEFFDKYKKQFDKFWKYIAQKKEYAGMFHDHDPERTELRIRDFAKKLLARIVFLHFLQKKGWMGCDASSKAWTSGDKKFMQNLFEQFSDKDAFHSKCLSELFYNTLNAKRTNDVFTCVGLSGSLANTKVPYLNGGLFDSDEYESKRIDFPTSYFDDLLDFFGQYNFTIDENDPNDHEVGIDPEMLGHIFENLLEDNKDKGAFYTPKVIVQYMCQESIIEYLTTSLNADTNTEVKTAIEELVRNRLAEKTNDLDLAEPIAKALFDVKICDPAIGSGAFPMGILNTIYQIIEELHWLQPDAVARTWGISDEAWEPHLVKKNIIQHSIYGVDIESGAVDIARLRFWLALVVDEVEPVPLPNLDYKIMQGNSLLESFEGVDLSQISNAEAYKAIYDEMGQIDIFSGEVKKKVSISLNFEDIQSLMDEYFSITEPERKKEIHRRIDEQVLNHIRFTFIGYRRTLEKKINKLKKDVAYKEMKSSTWQQKEKVRTISKEAKLLLKISNELDALTKKEHHLAELSKSDERPFFLWHLFFKDIFERDGFDIVIANPPYVGVKGNSKTFDLVKTGSLGKYAKGRAELFYFFFHLAIRILKEGGVSSFITTNYFPTATDGDLLRTELKNNTTLLKYYSFNELRIFSNAPGQHNAITVFKKGINYNIKLKSIDCHTNKNITDTIFNKITKGFDSETDYYEVKQNEIYEGESNYIRFKGVYGGNDDLKGIFQKFELAPRLIELAHVRQGLRTGIDKISDSHNRKYNTSFSKGTGVFVVTKQESSILGLIGEKVLKPFYKNSDINHYVTNECNTNNVLYIDKGWDEKKLATQAKKSFEHLVRFKPLIQSIRKRNNEDVDDWFTLDRPREEWIFTSEKVVVPQRSKKNKFSYSNTSFFASADVYYIVPSKKSVTAKYLTVLLNSSLYYFWYYNRGKRKGDMLELYQKPLSETPILIPEDLDQFEKIFDRIKPLFANGSDLTKKKAQVDAFILKYFGFSLSEAKIIDPNIEKQQIDYEAIGLKDILL